MAGIGNLQNVSLRELVNQKQTEQVQKNQETQQVESRDFGQTISDFITAVNDDQKYSAKQVEDVIQGKSENLHQAMASMEEARLSFQLMIEVRNKILESYQTLQRMQV